VLGDERRRVGQGDFAALKGEDAFEAFLAEIKFPPNPNRNIDNSLKPQLGKVSLQGDALTLLEQAREVGRRKTSKSP
jgi:hypothetical protein